MVTEKKRISLYAPYTLLASYWYRRAYHSEGADWLPSPIEERLYVATAKMWDRAAVADGWTPDDSEEYVRMYNLWQASGYLNAKLASLLREYGIEI